MKKCPQCSVVYNDDMSFCLNDGATLMTASESNLPPTMFNLPPPTAQNQTQPTVFGGIPPHTNEPPQFEPPPVFNQPQWGAQASPPRKNSYGGIIILGILLFLGLLGIGGAMLFIFTSSLSSQSSVYPTVTPTPDKTPAYDQNTDQGTPKNGFRQISIEDVTARKFYPSANKTSAATYEDGSKRVVSFLSVYDTPTDAEAAFMKHLEQIKREGKTITTRKDNYVYYNKGKSYSTAFWLTNKLYEYTADDQDTLYRFAK